MIQFEQQAKQMAEAIGVAKRRATKRRKGRPSCEDCFFHRQMLCALDLDEPCSTFRPNSADGQAASAHLGPGVAGRATGAAGGEAEIELIVTMRITVLGKSPSWEDAGGACSGYLIEDGPTSLLLDCGNGVFSKLRLFRDYTTLDAVLVSHLHADHILDLVPYAYALTYAPRQQPVPVAGYPGTDSPARPRLIAPSGARECFRRVVGAWGDEDLIESAFALEEYDAGSTVEVGTLRARFQEVPHFTTTYAIDFSSTNGSGRFTYGADCCPGEELIEIARGTDLLLVEATLPRPERTGIRGHMTPGEAGDHARRAGAGHVVLTHISDELDPDWARREGSEAFGGPVEMAREGAVYEV